MERRIVSGFVYSLRIALTLIGFGVLIGLSVMMLPAVYAQNPAPGQVPGQPPYRPQAQPAPQVPVAPQVQPQAAGGPAPRPPAGTIDLVRSRIYVKVDKRGLGHVHGVQGLVAGGQLFLGQAQQAGWMKFDLRSFDADTTEARKYVGLDGETDAATRKKVNDNMHGPHVLDVQQFPEAVFALRSAQVAPGSTPQKASYDLDGEFTLHRVKRPLRFQAHATLVEGMILLRGSFSLAQTDYAIRPYSTAMGAVGIADQLQVWGDIWIYP